MLLGVSQRAERKTLFLFYFISYSNIALFNVVLCQRIRWQCQNEYKHIKSLIFQLTKFILMLNKLTFSSKYMYIRSSKCLLVFIRPPFIYIFSFFRLMPVNKLSLSFFACVCMCPFFSLFAESSLFLLNFVAYILSIYTEVVEVVLTRRSFRRLFYSNPVRISLIISSNFLKAVYFFLFLTLFYCNSFQINIINTNQQERIYCSLFSNLHNVVFFCYLVFSLEIAFSFQYEKVTLVNGKEKTFSFELYFIG